MSFLQPQILHHLEHFEDLLQVVLANGEAHSVVGSLDLNQGIQIPGQLSDDYSEVCVLGAIYSCEKRKRKKTLISVFVCKSPCAKLQTCMFSL